MTAEVPLENYLQRITYGFTNPMPTAEEGPFMVTARDINGGRILYEQARRTSREAFTDKLTDKSRPEVGDVLVTKDGTLGRIAVVDQGDICINQSVALLRPNANIRPRYLKYLLETPKYFDRMIGDADGTTIKHIYITRLAKMDVSVPDLDAQDDVLSILGALDDKIDLNRRMSATLEEMARALYRSWFVDFDPVHARALGHPPAHMDPTTAALFPDNFGPDGLPRGWEAGTLGDIASNIRRQVQPGDIEADTPYIGLEHMPRRSIALSDWGGAGQVGSAKSAMRRGQILFGKLRPYFHKVGVVPTDGICSTDILVIGEKKDHWREMVLSVVSSDDFVEHANATSSGTRMPRSNWKDMTRFDIAVPPEPVVEAFSSIVRPMTEKIVAGIHEAHTLAALRDALLPRLMSGELRIREAEKRVEEVV